MQTYLYVWIFEHLSVNRILTLFKWRPICRVFTLLELHCNECCIAGLDVLIPSHIAFSTICLKHVWHSLWGPFLKAVNWTWEWGVILCRVYRRVCREVASVTETADGHWKVNGEEELDENGLEVIQDVSYHINFFLTAWYAVNSAYCSGMVKQARHITCYQNLCCIIYYTSCCEEMALGHSRWQAQGLDILAHLFEMFFSSLTIFVPTQA